MKRCNPDIRKFCSHIKVDDSEELEGEIIQCLKKKFAVKVGQHSPFKWCNIRGLGVIVVFFFANHSPK